MNDILFQIFIGAIISAYIVWRFIYSPKFTNIALQQFILDSLKTKDFEDFKIYQSERIKVNDRNAYAHWKSHIGKEKQDIIVEFDVHPSTFPISISRSEFVYIKDSEHFNNIQKTLERSNDYSQFLANDETKESVLSLHR